MALDAAVHRFIHRAAGNPYLEETLGRYLNLSLRIWYLVLDRLPHLFARVHEHEDLLHAIASGDPGRARAVVAEHIETFEREIRASYDRLKAPRCQQADRLAVPIQGED